MTLRVNERAVVDPDVMIRTVGGESVILDLKTERYLGLNDVGTRMWSAITGAASIQSAYETLLAEYDVEPERLRTELDKLLDQLLEQGLITLAPSTESVRD
jgi:hypothetical protein